MRIKQLVDVDFSLEQRLNLIQKLISLGFIAGILLSFNLWVSHRFFPLLPVSDAIPVLGDWAHYGLIGLLLLSLCASVFSDKRFIRVSTLALLSLLLLQDQNRWQPWVYMYALFFLAFAFKSKHKEALQTYFQLVLVGIYAWSGIHKLNPSFIDTVYLEILTGLFQLEDAGLITALKPIGYLIPLAEIAIALALLFPKSRHYAVYAAVAMHLFILLYLSPLGIGANTVVYPWNLTLIAMVLLLFYRVPGGWGVKHQQTSTVLNATAIVLVWVMPLFNFWGYWDNYLSFSLYSGKTNAFYIVVGEGELSKIDERLSAYFLPIEGLQGGQIIHVNKWALGELNVPFYPETRLLRQMSRSFCGLGIAEGQLYFLEFELPLEKQKFIRFTCDEVQ